MDSHHQRYAALCRHKLARQAKDAMFQSWDADFADYFPHLPFSERLHRYASSRRRKLAHDLFDSNGFRPSTLRTWLRVWQDRTHDLNI